MEKEKLNKILENHKHWLKEDCNGWENMRADLCPIYNGTYYISKKGEVYTQKGRLLSQRKNRNGYFEVELFLCGSRKHKTIHRLLAETFIPNPFSLVCVNHIDGNKENNELGNLEWCTHDFNMKHAAINRLIPTIEVFCPETKERYYSIHEAARKLHMSRNTISKAINTGNECSTGIHFFINRQEAVNY